MSGGCKRDDALREIAELVRIIAQSRRGDIPRESAAFAEFRRTCLAVMVRLKEALPDEYDLLEQTERAKIRFFWMLRRPLPRGPDGDALGRCLIRRFVGSGVRLHVG